MRTTRVTTIKGDDILNYAEVLDQLEAQASERRDDAVSEDELRHYRLRSKREIVEAERKLRDLLWLHHHVQWHFTCFSEGEDISKHPSYAAASKAAKRVIDTYGRDACGPYSDYKLGMMYGKLSAIRWVLKEEWDSLDI